MTVLRCFFLFSFSIVVVQSGGSALCQGDSAAHEQLLFLFSDVTQAQVTSSDLCDHR